MFNLFKRKEEVRYDKFKKKDFKKINDFLKNLKNSLDEDISFEITSGMPHFYYVHVYLKSKFLEKTNPTLYPLCYFSFLIIIKKNKKYEISQEFNIGSMFCEKEYAKGEFDLNDFEVGYHNISKETAIEKSRELADLLTLGNFKEIDERTLKIKKVSYETPNLIHKFDRFHVEEFDTGIIYTGSNINLKEELVKNLEDSLIETNLKVYNAFFKDNALK